MTQKLAHVVRLYRQHDRAVLAEVTVVRSTTLDEHGCRYVALADPVPLEAGLTYRLVTYNSSSPEGGDWMKYNTPLPPGIVDEAVITIDGRVSADGNGYPENPAGVSSNKALSGVLPSFRYTIVVR
jgi:hypothetical protein